ncbi:hypothetical protein WA538_000492, partial [Blastocystis sp. DL]
MHGRLRRLTEKSEEEIKQEMVKAIKLRMAGETVLAKIHAKDYSLEAFKVTGVVAKLNPDFYSIWNYRKDYLVSQIENPDLSEESKLQLLQSEVQLTEDIIREKDPKCYAVWHHRRWLFQKRPALLTEREIMLCERMLQADQRNFHCWNHWMLVTRQLGLSKEALLAFTWDRIKENSSNYSAWHFRGELLRSLLEEKYRSDAPGCLKLLHSELEVNLNALYTECDDQSSWYYMRTLFTIATELSKLEILPAEAVKSLFDSRLEELEELMSFAPDCIYGTKFIEELKEMETE